MSVDQFEIPNSDSNSRSVVFWTVHKAASRYLYGVFRRLVQSAGMPAVNFASMLFEQGESIEWTPESNEFVSNNSNGYFFGPFRQPEQRPTGLSFEDFTQILVVRDPRDIVTSHYFSNRFSHRLPGQQDEQREEKSDAGEIDEYVLRVAPRFATRFAEYGEMLSDQAPISVYRYEDLLFDFDNWIDEALKHIGVEPRARALAFVKENHEADGPATEDVSSHRRQVTPGDHQRKLKAETIDALNECFSESLVRFGYK